MKIMDILISFKIDFFKSIQYADQAKQADHYFHRYHSTGINQSTNGKKQQPPYLITTSGETLIVPNLNDVQKTLLHELSISDIKSNISITNSSNVHLGNVINYDGSLYLNILNNNKVPAISLIQDDKGVLVKPTSNIQLSDLPIIPRRHWSTRNPKEKYDKIKEPVKFIIISHTATTSAISPSKNIQLIRDIQAFHIDTHNWNDIGYNFLIGSDGTIYEGRGWGIEGAHTFGYNNRSIGVSFIGCFINRKPTDKAVSSCQNLLQRGIDEGHLSRNYKLLGHRQCSETESPGTKLYEEITTWHNFYNKSIDDAD